MRKTMGTLAALLGLWVSLAHAQVAVPELAPAGLRVYNARFPIAPMINVVPENPAAMQWGAPSRIGGGVLDGARNSGLEGASSNYDGSFGGFRWVRQRFALGAETGSLNVEYPGAPQVAGIEKKQSSFALSFSWPETLAIGLATHQWTLDTRTPPGGQRDTLEFSGWLAGLSWRLGEHFFAAGAFGQEDLERTFPVAPGSESRDHYMAGLALRGGGTLIWRLELDTFHRDDFKDPVNKGFAPAYDLNQLSAEGILGSWLLGGTAYDLQPLPSGAPTISGYSVDAGYAPLSGLTLTWRFEHSEQKAGGTPISKEEINNAVVTWQF